MTFVDAHQAPFAEHGFCALADSDPPFTASIAWTREKSVSLALQPQPMQVSPEGWPG